jgi:HPt (histidine-containing phosphotransfer) domain-containing protein
VTSTHAGPGPLASVRAQLAELCGSDDVEDWAMLGPVLDAFVEGSAERRDELVDAVRRSSVDEVEFLSHRLKGSALTLGVDDLAHVCGRLEADARTGVVDGSGQLIHALVRELQAAVSAVEQVRAALPADTSAPVPAPGW